MPAFIGVQTMPIERNLHLLVSMKRIAISWRGHSTCNWTFDIAFYVQALLLLHNCILLQSSPCRRLSYFILRNLIRVCEYCCTLVVSSTNALLSVQIYSAVNPPACPLAINKPNVQSKCFPVVLRCSFLIQYLNTHGLNRRGHGHLYQPNTLHIKL